MPCGNANSLRRGDLFREDFSYRIAQILLKLWAHDAGQWAAFTHGVPLMYLQSLELSRGLPQSLVDRGRTSLIGGLLFRRLELTPRPGVGWAVSVIGCSFRFEMDFSDAQGTRTLYRWGRRIKFDYALTGDNFCGSDAKGIWTARGRLNTISDFQVIGDTADFCADAYYKTPHCAVSLTLNPIFGH